MIFCSDPEALSSPFPGEDIRRSGGREKSPLLWEICKAQRERRKKGGNMASEDSLKRIQDGTHCQTSESVTLCANGCGFFGSAATLNLCSVCYRDYKIKQEQAASAKATMEKSLNNAPKTEPVAAPVVPVAPSSSIVPISSSTSSAAVEVVSAADATPAGTSMPAAKNRCFTCRKRVGVVGFSCRCGGTFCGVHRYPDEHACEFDFKTRGRDEIAKANPLVVKEKLERI